MTTHKKFFLILWALGFVGILSFLFIDLAGIIEILPSDVEVPPMAPWLIKGLSLIQPTVILSIAVLVGIGLAPKVGLSAPVAESLAKNENWFPALKPQIVPGIIGGVISGLAIVVTAALLKPLLPAEAVVLIGKFGNVLPLPTRFLYGGVTEELLLRWGLMTLLAWLAWRLFQKGQGSPRSSCFVAAILVSSLIFGIGHLPVAFLLFPHPTPTLILFVLTANSTFGLIAGYLYWKKGLESAMIGTS
ncbi:MAG TPA: CPBP family intramembrane metalloprotease [Pyrinomonadaceae bacterium]|nr:CPBP family intramembrane metalloprotease [Pyrinomonadaceae bacterium]